MSIAVLCGTKMVQELFFSLEFSCISHLCVWLQFTLLKAFLCCHGLHNLRLLFLTELQVADISCKGGQEHQEHLKGMQNSLVIAPHI